MSEKQSVTKTRNKLLQKKYSEKTITTYLFYLQKYFEFLKNKKIKDNPKSVQKFLDQKKKEKLSTQSLNLILNILNFFYTNVQTNVDKLVIKHYKTKDKRPQTLNELQIKKLLANTNNTKHYLIFALAYGSGLKISELVSLRVKDLDFENNLIKICNKQGKQLRTSILPTILKDKLQQYIKTKKTNFPLFSNTKSTQLSTRTLQQAFIRALNRSKIKKQASFQSLRHSFATQVLESGVDKQSLQKVLGLKNIRSIDKYKKNIKIEKIRIKSPL
ncbi:MAG: hypothetical protein COX80_00720 [Candidatus Magasanikbacteria bacterium CG_4_10_14_0_2_um_filter_33_14]|uniref:Integrase n=1 Tax=Candidatus Magasanikbacteria bacterium CG_4_10_14_0_2_um_filter_33_14 TaxID=1974636 RepID=A0A2M7VBT7_9BACT|nr:MAG: hypothetical protein COX80_00720 [Candidatus Magasanikbacteria bacterium CG_4_10_14_0_2_um_filter_33_14]